MSETKKTHWLESPNKNYLGHQDLPNGNDIILIIKKAKWEEVKNPITQVSTSKRVIRWKDKNIKPFICNETNAKAILKSTKEKYMEDCEGKRIKLTISTTKVMGDMVDCIRVSKISISNEKENTITKEQLKELTILLYDAKKNETDFCKAMKINELKNLQASKLNAIVKRLKEIKSELYNIENT